jgi:hypothetical protein
MAVSKYMPIAKRKEKLRNPLLRIGRARSGGRGMFGTTGLMTKGTG